MFFSKLQGFALSVASFCEQPMLKKENLVSSNRNIKYQEIRRGKDFSLPPLENRIGVKNSKQAKRDFSGIPSTTRLRYAAKSPSAYGTSPKTGEE